MTNKKVNIAWNVCALIETFCGMENPQRETITRKIEVLCRKINVVSADPLKPKAVQKWRERGQIPGIRLAELSVVANSQGKIFKPIDFIMNRERRLKRAPENKIDIFT